MVSAAARNVAFEESAVTAVLGVPLEGRHVVGAGIAVNGGSWVDEDVLDRRWSSSPWEMRVSEGVC